MDNFLGVIVVFYIFYHLVRFLSKRSGISTKENLLDDDDIFIDTDDNLSNGSFFEGVSDFFEELSDFFDGDDSDGDDGFDCDFDD